jgi:tRNA modification GTPase
MNELNDTIVAVSSPTAGERVIVRISGPDTIEILQQIYRWQIANGEWPPFLLSQESTGAISDKQSLVSGSVFVGDELKVDAQLYLFLAPHSYTGEDVAEIHIYTNSSVTESLISNLLNKGARMAGPGEFTARAYLNGKMDLTQAEAVNEIVTSCNRFQLDAAEKLLAGRLAETTEKVSANIMDCLSLIEAGMDFSGEDIEFITVSDAVARLAEIKNELEQLLSGSISYESVIDLPAVGIAGAGNAGKSSLLNKLLGEERSIVSEQRRTTRDVLTGLLTLSHCRCVLFDCAGLDAGCSILDTQCSILDELAQAAAIEALRRSCVVVFCVDISKGDWTEDISIRMLVEPKTLIPVATKCDLLSGRLLKKRLRELGELFAADLDCRQTSFLVTSAKTGAGLERLRDTIDEKIIELAPAPGFRQEAAGVALTARHKQAVSEAIKNVNEAIDELKHGNDEVAAMMLRAAYQGVSNIQQQVDEEILERIFSRFCIGK